MYRKLHLQLTLFCCIVISFILITMTFLSLKIIEDNQSLKQFNDFQKNMNNIYQILSEQDNISHTWLKKISIDNELQFSILDNEIPIIYEYKNDIKNNASIFKQAREIANTSYTLSDVSVKSSNYMKHIEFKMDNIDSKSYLASVGYIPKKFGILTVTILYVIPSKTSILKGLFLPIVLTSFAAIFILSLCSFFLIKNLIRPLIKNHNQQVSFFAAASHELRSPLAVIMTSLPLLKKPSIEKQSASYSLIEKECRRMQRLINDMFTLSSLDSGSISIHKKDTFINNLLIESYEKFENIAARENIHIDFHLPDTLIPEIECDSERIAQVFTILLDNAISYTPQGGLIQINLTLQANQIVISIADNGPGIPDEKKEKIFHRFYRCDDSRTDKNHFGLGLSIAKEIIDLHNGTIYAGNSILGGAEFTVILPSIKQHP
ncbi:MAG: HAMP domain-containing sensor histidine kinase [Lachnospiraceae bacterium]|nr:HAMP domain-containing sensor histidine kinase [Lachnospiraceae bacterium]